MIMKQNLQICRLVKRAFIYAWSICLFCMVSGCFWGLNKASTEELTKEVRKSMVETFRSENVNIRIKNLTLVHEMDNVYSGVLETQGPEGEYSYNVKVVYDGEAFTWEILDW